MEIHGPHGPQGINPVFPRRAVRSADSVAPSSLEMPQDEVQISPEAQALAEAAQSGQIRQERIEQIRQMIAGGVYETPERLAVAIDRLLQRIQGPNQGPTNPT